MVFYKDVIDNNVYINKKLYKGIKKFSFDSNNPTDRKIIENLDTQVDKFIAQDRKGSIRQEFPGELLNSTLREVLQRAKSGDKAARTAKKLLMDNRFLK